jgi:opacity protein-like surface antigen
VPGPASPNDDIRAGWNNGLGLIAGVEVPYREVSVGGLAAALSLRGDVALATFGMNHSAFAPPSAGLEGGRLMGISAFAHVKGSISAGPLMPYALLGAGLTTWSISEVKSANGGSITGIEIEDQVGITAGIGAEVRVLRGTLVFAEVKPMRTLGGDGYSPIHLGVRLR